MMHIDKLVKAANIFLGGHPIRWKKGPNDVKAAAVLLLVNRGLIENPHKYINKNEINTKAISDEIALAILARVQEWLKASPKEADQITRDILATLKICGYKFNPLSTITAVGAHEITTKAEAAEASERLLNLSKEYKCNTELQLGLLKSLYNWNQYQAYGYSTPPKLKDIRKKLNFTQEKIAKDIKITHRQYARYEAGKSPVPKKRALAIDKLLNDPSAPSKTKGPAKSPKRAPQQKNIKIL